MSEQTIGTTCVQGGYHPGDAEPRQVPIYQSTTWKYDTSEHMGKLFDLEESGYFYSRLQNPTCDLVAAKICEMEGGTAAMLTSSGMAANFLAIFNVAGAGDHVVASSAIYGGTYNLLAHTMGRMGVTCTFVAPDCTDEELEAAFQPNTKLVFGETIANPALAVLDIERFAKAAHDHGVPLMVDNTFPTPVMCRPFEWGADIVTHSTTKYMDGHAAYLGGVIVDGGNFDWKASGKYAQIAEPNPSYHGVSFAEAAGPAAFATYVRAILLRDEGACISPFNAWILLQGTETLSLRVDRHVENTKKVVEFLAGDSHVAKVNHPSLSEHPDHELYQKYFPRGGASIFTFEIKGGQEAAWKFIDHLQVFSLLANVADVKSLVVHPATTTHSQLSAEELAEQNITPSTIRLSIGTENAEDIIWDLKQAFAALDE